MHDEMVLRHYKCFSMLKRYLFTWRTKWYLWHLLATALIVICRRQRCRRAAIVQNCRRHFWVHPLFVDRLTTGAYYSLMMKMREVDRQKIFGFKRIYPY